jgi:hypothetical protein
LTADTWEQVTEALVQKSNLTVLADTANVSIPTMRKLLSNRYGHRIKFQRGRSGGVTLISA